MDGGLNIQEKNRQKNRKFINNVMHTLVHYTYRWRFPKPRVLWEELKPWSVTDKLPSFCIAYR